MLLGDNSFMKQEKYNFTRLKNYAEWYYFRYYPSDAKFLQKLREKWETDDAQRIFNEMKEFLVEDRTLETLIENYIYRNKNYRYIKQKMREKLFPAEKVEKYLEKYKDSWESLLREEYLIRKIEHFLQKGKSRNYIFQKLSETPEDKDLLENVFTEYFVDWDHEALRKEYEKIKSKFEKPKIIQKLLMKGFCYDDIKKLIKNLH